MQRSADLLKEDLIILALMIITVPLTGELKFYPFNDTFRVSFGTTAFFFFLLWIRKRYWLVLSGFIVGISVISFRIALDWIVNRGFQFEYDFIIHFSSAFYYATYSSLFYLVRVNNFHSKPLIIGFMSIFIEITSAIVELSVRHFVLGNLITIPMLSKIIIIAIIRSFFALSFFTVLKLHEAKLESKQHQERNIHMLSLISNLYEESIQLKKTLRDSEDITRKCYNLYRKLEKSSSPLVVEEISKEILQLAGEIHEIKKDNQRIYAGLNKLISAESSSDYMDILKIYNIILKTNKNYAMLLNKNITFISNIQGQLPPLHIYTVLSIINNLVSNAVESIVDSGLIKISIDTTDHLVQFTVWDNGVGIPQKKKELIFKPGYTTKYDVSGNPSTGMGLPYVKELVANLNGTLTVESITEKNETIFTIKIPINSLIKKG